MATAVGLVRLVGLVGRVGIGLGYSSVADRVYITERLASESGRYPLVDVGPDILFTRNGTTYVAVVGRSSSARASSGECW